MKSFAKVVLIGLLFFLSSNTLFAQSTASINGFVRDASNGEPLLFVNLAIEGSPRGTSTNESGYFKLTGLQAGPQTILCSYIGYDLFEMKLTLEAGENRRIDIELQPAGIQMEEVVVQSDREKEENTNIGVARMPTALIKNLPAVFEADVFRSVQLLPGVKASSDFSAGLYIRGGSPDQTLIMLDRTVVYNPTHFFGFFSTFNPDAIKDVRLYKGGYPAEYGGRLGSVLDIYNKEGNSKAYEGGLSVGTFASRAVVEGPLKNGGSFMWAARRSTLEPLLALLEQSVDNVPSFYFLDSNGKINLNLGENDKLNVSYYAGRDDVDLPFLEDANFGLIYGNSTGSVNWTHLFGDATFLNLTSTYSYYYSNPTASLAGTTFRRNNNVQDISIKADIEYLPNNLHEIEAGLWAGSLLLRIQDEFDGEVGFTSRIQSNYISAYLQDAWRPTDRWKVVGGLRLNAFENGEYVRLEPRLSAEYQLTERTKLQSAVGTYYQFLTLITNEAFSGFDLWLTTDEGVRPAWGNQFIFGVKSSLNQSWDIEVESYYRTMEDLFELDPFIPDAAGLEYADLFRVGDGFAYGLELTLRRNIGRLNGFIGYNYAVVRRRFPNFNNNEFYPPRYDRLNDFNIVANYELSRNWTATAVFAYYTGQAYTRPLGRTAAFDLPFQNEQADVIIPGKVNANRLPAYHRADIGFTYKKGNGFFGLGNNVEWKFQIINIYNRRNIWFNQLDLTDNPAVLTEVQQLPILPNISYSVKF